MEKGREELAQDKKENFQDKNSAHNPQDNFPRHGKERYEYRHESTGAAGKPGDGVGQELPDERIQFFREGQQEMKPVLYKLHEKLLHGVIQLQVPDDAQDKRACNFDIPRYNG